MTDFPKAILDRILNKTEDYLLLMQGADGAWKYGFANSTTTAMYLAEEVAANPEISINDIKGLSAYLINSQNVDGSWSDGVTPGGYLDAIFVNKLALEDTVEKYGERLEPWRLDRLQESLSKADSWLEEKYGTTSLSGLSDKLSLTTYIFYQGVRDDNMSGLRNWMFDRYAAKKLRKGSFGSDVYAPFVLNMMPTARIYFSTAEYFDDDVAKIRTSQNANGLWDMTTYGAIYNLLALDRARIKADDPVVVNARKGLQLFIRSGADGVRLDSYIADTWNGYFVIAGLLERNEQDLFRPEVLDAVEYLLDCEGSDGRFSFISGGETQQDNDTTGLLLDLFVRINKILKSDQATRCDARIGLIEARIEGVLARTPPALEAFQGTYGGWASYIRSSVRKGPGAQVPGLRKLADVYPAFPMPIADAPVADVTAHALMGLGAAGFNEDNDLTVKSAIYWLAADFTPNAGWWGRWAGGYVYGTAEVLMALSVVARDEGCELKAEAMTLLMEHQNRDGGWGEDLPSADDPDLDASFFAMHGPSSPMLTARVLSALMAAGVPVDEAVISDGVGYLIREFIAPEDVADFPVDAKTSALLSHADQRRICWSESLPNFTETPLRSYADGSIVFADAVVYHALSMYAARHY